MSEDPKPKNKKASYKPGEDFQVFINGAKLQKESPNLTISQLVRVSIINLGYSLEETFIIVTGYVSAGSSTGIEIDHYNMIEETAQALLKDTQIMEILKKKRERKKVSCIKQ
jgi:hypothetical protein